MPVTLVTVPDVEIVSTGTYQLASGETTFTAQMLADAVAAFNDPTVTAPRLKIGHTDPRFADAIASGDLDGEPAFGVLSNLRLSDDGQTILGDYVNVPDWLADTLPSSYPGRSIEGGFNFTAASGRKYSLVITACALLGVTWPGVGSLEDLQEVLTANGQAPAAGDVQDGEIEQAVVARLSRPGQDAPRGRHEALAGMDVGDVRMRFYDMAEGGNLAIPAGMGPPMWWWVRSIRVEDDGSLVLIVDDDEGHLLQIPFTVDGQDVTFGDPTVVVEQYVPVSAGARPRAIASWLPTRAARRPSNPTEETTTMRINGSEVDTAALRTRLGLADDATEQTIADTLGIQLETPEAETEPAAPAEPVAASQGQQPRVPEGMVLIDQETLQGLQSGAQTAQTLAERQERADRDAAITAAIRDGKIPVSARQRYTDRWDRDPDETRRLLTASADDGGLAPGLVPVGQREIGAGGDGDSQPQAAAAEHEGFMARFFPNEHARLSGQNGRTRIRQEA